MDICKTLWQVFGSVSTFLSAVSDVAVEEGKSSLVVPQFRVVRQMIHKESCKWYKIHGCEQEMKMKLCDHVEFATDPLIRTPEQTLDQIEKEFWERQAE